MIIMTMMNKIKKVKQPSLKELQKKIWEECKRIIKIRYGDTCYTCGARNLKGSNRHTGHLVPKKYLPYKMKYDLRLLRPQCYNCNMNLGGMGALFLKRMVLEDNTGITVEILRDVESHKKNNITPKEAQSYYILLLDIMRTIDK